MRTLGLLSAIVWLALTIAGCSDADDATSSSSTTALLETTERTSDSGDDATSSSTTASSTTTAPAGPEGSDGCGTDPEVDGPSGDGPGDVERAFLSGSEQRSYRLAVPDSYDPDEPVPLILNLHGATSNAIQQSVYSNLPRRAAERGAITITPDAVGGLWQLSSDGTDDAFLVALVQDAMDRYCVDPARVHVAGLSLGAFKAAVTGCAHPDLFASIALVTVEVRPGDCPAMPVLAFHGTADNVVPYGEGADPGVVVTGPNAGLPGAQDNMAAWAEGGGCSADKDVEPIGTDIERWSYPDCVEGVDVDFYSIKGGGHTWPGSEIVIGPTTQTIDATDLALDFFASHPRPGPRR